MTLRKLFKKATRPILRSSAASWLASALAYAYAWAVFRTTRWKVEGLERVDEARAKHGCLIGAAWHSRIMMMPFFYGSRFYPGNFPISALVSQHRDGRIVANFLKMLGLDTVDGSTTAGATGAALQISRLLEEKRSVFIIPDGPVGPRQRAAASPVYFASKTGVPVLPMVYSAARAAVFENSWDKTILPLPFSRGIMIVGEPIYVPRDAGKEELEAYRLRLEEALNEMMARADAEMGRQTVLPATAEEIEARRERKNRKKDKKKRKS